MWPISLWLISYLFCCLFQKGNECEGNICEMVNQSKGGGEKKVGGREKEELELRENSNAGHLVMEHQRLGPLEREIRLASVPVHWSSEARLVHGYFLS